MTLYFTKEHEWIRVEGDTASIGISDHAQEQLGDETADACIVAGVPFAGRGGGLAQSVFTHSR